MSRKAFIPSILFVISTIIYSDYVTASPVITRINMASDGYVEIWGTGFGSKSNVKPLLWLDYESDNDPNLYRINMSSADSHGRVVTDPKNSANKAFSYDMATSPNEAAAGPGNLPFNSKNLYVNVKRYYAFSINQPELLISPNGSGLNIKPFRLWSSLSDNNVSARHNLHFSYNGLDGVNSGAFFAEYTEDSRGADWLGNAIPFTGNRWVNQEITYSSSDLNLANGYIKIVQDGNKASSRLINTIDTAHPAMYSLIFFDQTSNYQLPNNPLVVYYDDVFIDDSFSRIIFADSADPNGYKEALPVIPVIWQTDYIKAKLTHSINLQKNYFLFVYDNTNSGNQQGFRVCTRCPKPPLPN